MDETVLDYWTANADEGDQRLALSAEGWEIVHHTDGLTVLSPGTSIAELNNRDDSTETMSSLTAILNEERTWQ